MSDPPRRACSLGAPRPALVAWTPASVVTLSAAVRGCVPQPLQIGAVRGERTAAGPGVRAHSQPGGTGVSAAGVDWALFADGVTLAPPGPHGQVLSHKTPVKPVHRTARALRRSQLEEIQQRLMACHLLAVSLKRTTTRL